MISKALSDIELLQKLKGGDDKALGEIINRYGTTMLSIAKHRLEQIEDAEDCVQDVMVNLWSVREKLEVRHGLPTYLSACVKHQVYKVLSKQHRAKNELTEFTQPFVEASGCSAESDYLYKELLLLVEQTVCELPERCRIVFTKRNNEGKDIKQIAEEMNISPKTVTSHLDFAKKQIIGKLSTGFPASMVILFASHYTDLIN